MKSANSMDFSYIGLLHKLYYSKDSTDKLEVQKILDDFIPVPNSIYQNWPVFFVIDYAKLGYQFITEGTNKLVNKCPQEMLEGGLDLTINEIFVQKSFDTFNQKLFPVITGFLKKTLLENHRDYVFSFNYCVNKEDNKLAHILQKCSYVTDQTTGLPLLCLAVLTDISAFKKDNTMVLTIEKKKEANELKNSLVDTQYFFPYEEDTLLTKQEKNILSYMADGLSSKQIAFKLKIAENTIANHRQNMLRKTNTKNVAELIAFTIRSGII